MSSKSWDYDAMAALTGRLSGLMGDHPVSLVAGPMPGTTPSTLQRAERRGEVPPRAAAGRSEAQAEAEAAPPRIDPEVAQILSGTRKIAELGSGPKTAAKAGPAPAQMVGGILRPWQRLKRAAAVLGIALALGGAAVGPVLNAPDGADRAVVAMGQTYTELAYRETHNAGERESLTALWQEGFQRLLDGNPPVAAPAGPVEPGLRVSFADGFQPMLDHVRATREVPQMHGWSGAPEDGFELTYRNLDGHLLRMEVPGQRMADGRWASDVFLDTLNESGAHRTQDNFHQAPVIEKLPGDSPYVTLYNSIAESGGMTVKMSGGQLITVTPTEGELKVHVDMPEGHGPDFTRTITADTFDSYRSQMLDIVQQRQAQSFNRPGLGR